MRIGVFSDVHSNYHALVAVLADMRRRGVDRMVCLGDITMKGPLPKECVDLVRSLGCPVVRGNTDGAYHPDFYPHKFRPVNRSQEMAQRDFDRHVAALSEEDRLWLQNLPIAISDTIDGVRMDFFHATPTNNYVLILPWTDNATLATLHMAEETKLSLFGHCHRAFIRNVEGRTVVNAGSVGLPFDGDPRPSYALVEVEGGSTSVSIVRVPYDPTPAIRAARDVGMAGWELFAHTVTTGRFPG
ncbi:MAG TPA: metallophosphoesterase family protein [Symbiobacteriaceae bacterium]